MYKEGDDKMEGNEMEQDGQDDGQEVSSYLDSCIEMVDSMIQDPKTATPENLKKLKQDLEMHSNEMEMDEMDGQDSQDSQDSSDSGDSEYSESSKSSEQEGGKPSLVIAIGDAMKKRGKQMAILALLFLGLTSFCHAERKYTRLDWQKASSKDTYLFYSTDSASALTTNQINFTTNIVTASTFPVIIHTVVIETTGTYDSKIEIFNSCVSTFATGMYGLSPISGAIARTLLYDVYFDSGMAVNNQGTTPAKFTITYKEK